MKLPSWLTSYLGHLTGYIVAGATIVTSIDPKMLPPQYTFITALAGFVVTASHHSYTAGSASSVAQSALNAAIAAATKAVDTVGAPVAKLLVVGMLMGASITGLSGCASVQSFLSSPTGATIVSAGVQVAVTTAEQRGVSAAQINRVAKSVLAADSGTAATVVSVTSLVNGQLVKLGVPSGDVAGFQILTTAFDAYVVAKYGANVTVQQIQADVAMFLGTVIADTGG